MYIWYRILLKWQNSFNHYAQIAMQQSTVLVQLEILNTKTLAAVIINLGTSLVISVCFKYLLTLLETIITLFILMLAKICKVFEIFMHMVVVA